MLSHHLHRKLKIGPEETLEKGYISFFSSQSFLTQVVVEEKNASVRLAKTFSIYSWTHVKNKRVAAKPDCQSWNLM